MIRKYRKVPVVIEAVRLCSENLDAVNEWCGGEIIDGHAGLFIETTEGLTQARPGNYVIRSTAGEFYHCKANVFHEFYDEVDDD